MKNKTCIEISQAIIKILNHKGSIDQIMSALPKDYIFTYHKNETIINVREKVDYIYFLLQGQASVWGEIEWENNIIAYVQPIEILGLLEVLNETLQYTAFVMAETECRVFKIQKDIFIHLIKENSDICYYTLKALSKMTSNNMEEAAIKRIFTHDDIIGHYFYLQSKHKRPYICHYTRGELSEILNINLRTLYRHLARLQDEGFLNIQKGKIIITEKNFKLLENRYDDLNI